MKKKKRLSEKEDMVMELLWMKKEPLTSVEMFHYFEADGWNENNVYRSINALLERGFIRVCGQQLYHSLYARKFEPTITREEYIVQHLCRVKKSMIAQIVTALIKEDDNEGNGDAELIAHLDTIVRELREKQGDK